MHVYVSPHATAETTATFQVPLNTQNVVLKFSFWDTTVSVPLAYQKKQKRLKLIIPVFLRALSRIKNAKYSIFSGQVR